jgi:hypothetical protein
MNYKILKMLSLLAGCSLCGVLTAQAQDKATLDLLVKKGVISQSDADSIAKTSATPMVVTRSSTVQKITLEGMVQFDYNDLTASDGVKTNSNPVATNQMYFRRVMMGAKVDLGNDWGGEIMMDFAATQIADQPKSGLSPQAFPTTASTVGGQQGIQYISQNMFDKIAITKQIPGYGQFEAGYDKTNWIQEEMTPTGQLPAIERSIATRYFDEYYGSQTAYRLAFGQRRTGLFWNGTATGIDGLYYSAALTDGIQSQINFTNVGGLDKIGAWTGAGYKNKVDDVSFDFGVNLGYSGDGNSQNNITTSATAESAALTLENPSHLAQRNSSNDTYGYNPYIKVTAGDFSLLAEFFQSRFQNGRSTIPFTTTNLTNPGATSAAAPYGLNIIPVYKVTPDLDVDLRLSYLNTNGRGTDQNGVMWNAPNDVASSISGTTGAAPVGGYGPLFNSAYSAYLGFNWAVSPGVRFSAGVEHVWFQGRQTYTAADGTSNFNGPGTTSNNIRAQLQVSW